MKFEIFVLNTCSSIVIHLLLHLFITLFLHILSMACIEYCYVYVGGMDRRGGDKPGVSASDRDDTAAGAAGSQSTGGRGGGADTGSRRISESSSRSESDSQLHQNNQQQQRSSQPHTGRRGEQQHVCQGSMG